MSGRFSQPSIEVEGNNVQSILQNFSPQTHRGIDEAVYLRDSICIYVNQPYAYLPWQFKYNV